LKKAIEGEVRFDSGSRALYATDGSNYRQVPIGVVIPKSIQDVFETTRQCRLHGAPSWRVEGEPAAPRNVATLPW
jgi:FAD/FMN-containing dehydrogenase